MKTNPMPRPARRIALALGALLPLALLFSAGCDVDSADSVTAVVSSEGGTIYDFTGLYMSRNNTTTNDPLPLVYPTGKQSGATLTWLRLLQYGSVLEAYDNANQKWSGKISSVKGSTAHFSLQGKTTAGQSVEVLGTMTYASQTSTIDATWIEPAFAGSLFAQATVSPAATNTPGTSLKLTASPTSVALSNSVALTASGGSGSYVWPTTASFGTISGSGTSATYTRTSGTTNNSATISVTSGSETKSVTIGFL